MTATRFDITTRTTASGRATTYVRLAASGLLALVAIVVLSAMSRSPIAVAAAVAVAIILAGAAFLWNEPETLFPIAIYVMWFDGLPLGYPVNTGRTVAFLAIAIPTARVLTSSWRIPAIQRRVWLPTVLLLTWCTLSLLWSADFGTWASGMMGIFLGISYAFLFAVFVKSPEQSMRLFRGFIVFGVVVAAMSAILHYVFGFRSVGFSGGPNEYAMVNVQAVPIAVVLARRATGRWRLFFILAVPALCVGILASGSRSGLIGLGAISVFCFVFRPGLTWPQRAMWSVVAFFALIAGAVIAALIDPDRFGLLAFLSDRGAGRLDIWAGGWLGLKTHWLLGYGIGGFEKQALGLIQRATGASLTVVRQEDFRQTNSVPAHNIFLQAGLDLGIIGFTLFFGTLLVGMKNLWDMLRTEWHDVAWIGLGCITAYLAMGPFASQLNPKMPWAMVGIPGAYYVRHVLTDRQSRRSLHLGRTVADVDR